jgi:hypothetical protein
VSDFKNNKLAYLAGLTRGNERLAIVEDCLNKTKSRLEKKKLSDAKNKRNKKIKNILRKLAAQSKK